MNLHSLPVKRIICFSSWNYCCQRSEIFQRVDSDAAQGDRMSLLKQKPDQTAHWSRVKVHKTFCITGPLSPECGRGLADPSLTRPWLSIIHVWLQASVNSSFHPVAGLWPSEPPPHPPPALCAKQSTGKRAACPFFCGPAGWWDPAVPSVTSSWATLANASRRLIFHKYVWWLVTDHWLWL